MKHRSVQYLALTSKFIPPLLLSGGMDLLVLIGAPAPPEIPRSGNKDRAK